MHRLGMLHTGKSKLDNTIFTREPEGNRARVANTLTHSHNDRDVTNLLELFPPFLFKLFLRGATAVAIP